MKTTWLANAADWISTSFEKLNPAFFRMLAALLPYTTPFPVAWYTSRNAELYLNFTPGVAFVFVFGLEGIGIWFTSMFVEAVIDWIRSANWKTIWIPLLLGSAVGAYVWLLVSLNVTLDSINNPNANTSLSNVIFLMCFLPLLTGIGNGYYKWKLEMKFSRTEREQADIDKEERRYQDRRSDRMELKRLKLQNSYQSTTHQASGHSDWRKLSDKEKREVKEMSAKDIMEKHGVSRATAYNWKSQSEDV